MDKMELKPLNVPKLEFKNSDIAENITISTSVDLMGKVAENLRCIVSTLVGTTKTLVGRSELIRNRAQGNFTRKYNLPFDFSEM
jgi:hypothetical protein